MSVHVAILKVLSSYPDGLAAPAALNADLAILSGSQDWTLRMRKLAARLPGLDIFSQKLVVRGAYGWQLTAAGRAILDLLEDRRDSGSAVAKLSSANRLRQTKPEEMNSRLIRPCSRGRS